MTDWLDAILIWTALKLPESRAGWVEDLRNEARHVPGGIRRFRFLSSGVFAASGQLLRINVGPRRVGQGLVGLALFCMCLGIGMAAATVDDRIAQTLFYGVLPLYGLAGGLIVFNLPMARLYTALCSLLFVVVSAILCLPVLGVSELPVRFLRAFTFEGSFIMAALFIAASYLNWIEDARYA